MAITKLPYGSLATIARKCKVSEQYVNTVLKEHHCGKLIERTAAQKAIVRAYKRMANKYAQRGIVVIFKK